MLSILKAYGIPEELVTAIRIKYEDTTVTIITPDGETFNILAGVLQGDTLAPYLFVIVIDYVMRIALLGREDKLGFQVPRGMDRQQCKRFKNQKSAFLENMSSNEEYLEINS